MCIAVQSHRKIPKGPKVLFLKFFIEKMCMFYISSFRILHKGPVKLIKRVKIAHSFLQSMSSQFLGPDL